MDTDFNKAGGAKVRIDDYIIELSPRQLDAINRLVWPAEFKRRLQSWVAEQTGCVPDVQLIKEHGQDVETSMDIRCTQDLADKIQQQFAGDIASITKVRKFSDIPPGERNCWKKPKR